MNNEFSIRLIGDPKVIMSNPHGLHNYFGWPSIVKMRDGTIVVAASGFRRGHVCPFGKVCIARSYDEGNTYTRPEIVIDTPLDDRDAGLLAFGDDSLIVTSFNNTVEFQRSQSGSKYNNAYLDCVDPSSEAEYLGSEFIISNDGGITFDKIHKSPVTSPHGPCLLSDGRILWVGRCYSDHDSFSDGLQGIRCYEIEPEGKMIYIGSIPDIPGLNSCEPYAIELADGSLICQFRVEPDFTIYQSESFDKGVSWTEPHPVLPPHGGAPSHILRHSSGILISVYGYRERPYGVRAMFSFDNGKTWDTDHILYSNSVSSDLGYPMTVELSDGSLLTCFYAKEDKEEGPCVIMQQKWRIDSQ